jgi:hypothetical protein
MDFRVRVLTRDQLKGIRPLPREGVRGRYPATSDIPVQAQRTVHFINTLGRIGIEGTRIEIRTIRQLRRVGIQEFLDDGANGRVRGKRRTLTGEGYEHIAVDHPRIFRCEPLKVIKPKRPASAVPRKPYEFRRDGSTGPT